MREIQVTDVDGGVMSGFAHDALTVNTLIELLSHVQEQNRDLPLRFGLRLDAAVPRSIPMAIITRARLPHDVMEGEKVAFLTASGDRAGLLFLIDPPTEYAISVASPSVEERTT